MKRLLSTDPITGVSSWHEYDSLTDQTTIYHTSDAEPYLNMNKERAKDDELTKNGIKNGMWLYASIPPGLQVKWLIEDGLDVYNKDHRDRLFKKLADPEYQYLKCTSKKHL